MTNIELLLDYNTRIVADLPALELPRSRRASSSKTTRLLTPASGKYKMDLDCDHTSLELCRRAEGTTGDCASKMFADAEASLAAESKHYYSLKASCDAKERDESRHSHARVLMQLGWLQVLTVNSVGHLYDKLGFKTD